MRQRLPVEIGRVYRTRFDEEFFTMTLHPYVIVALRWAGWTVLALVAFLVCCNVVNRCGQVYGLVLAGIGCGAAWAPSEQCRRIIGLFANAVRRHMKEEAAAFAMGCSKSQYSEGVNCVKQISMSRATDVGPDVWLTFAIDLVQQSGTHVVIEKGPVADLVLTLLAQNELLKAEQRARGFARMERAS